MQREPCLFFRRGDLDLAAVCAGDLGSYVETEAEALVRRPTVSAKEGLKELPFDNVINRIALVRDRKRESLFIGRRPDRIGRPAPCFIALATRFEAMSARFGSQLRIAKLIRASMGFSDSRAAR
jgi:hypothetical protein